MPTIIPFKGIIPNPELAYSLVNGKEFYSFPLISVFFEDYLQLNKIQEEDLPSIYLYRVRNSDKSHTGIWVCTSPEDLKNGNIRKHEKIHVDRSSSVKEMFREKKIDFNPILLTYPGNTPLDEWIVKEVKNPPFFSIREEKERAIHEIWKIRDQVKIGWVLEQFENLNPVYLADGHHRAEAFQNYIEEERSMGRILESEKIGFTSLYLSLKEVEIKAYHRIIKLWDSESLKIGMAGISYIFNAEKRDNLEIPIQKGDFFMINFHKEMFKLTLKDDVKKALGVLNPKNSAQEILDHLDVSIIQELIFFKVLGIGTDKPLGELNYLGGRHSEKTIQEKVFSGEYSMGFLLAPPEFEEIQTLSDAGLFMPPKSTYFEPKIPSGLIIQKLE